MLPWACSIIPSLTLPRHTLAIKLLFVKQTVASTIVSPLYVRNGTHIYTIGRAVNEPDLGKAGTTYARNVQTKKAMPLNALPDPGLVFDTLLKARDVSACTLSVVH
jgi:hypothetical protein